MGRGFVAIVLGLVFIVALIVQAPARLLVAVIPVEQVQAQGFAGTLWRGSLRRVAVALDDQYLALGETHWRLHPLSLLTLSPTVTVHSEWGRQHFSAALTVHNTQDVELSDLELRFSASVLRHWLPLQLTGTLELQSPLLRVENGSIVAGAGRLVWQDAGFLAGANHIPLGSYALDFQVSGDGVLRGEVMTLAGPIEVSGPVQLQEQRYQLDLQLRSAGPIPTQLSEALLLIASPEGDGFHIELEAVF